MTNNSMDQREDNGDYGQEDVAWVMRLSDEQVVELTKEYLGYIYEHRDNRKMFPSSRRLPVFDAMREGAMPQIEFITRGDRAVGSIIVVLSFQRENGQRLHEDLELNDLYADFAGATQDNEELTRVFYSYMAKNVPGFVEGFSRETADSLETVTGDVVRSLRELLREYLSILPKTAKSVQAIMKHIEQLQDPKFKSMVVKDLEDMLSSLTGSQPGSN